LRAAVGKSPTEALSRPACEALDEICRQARQRGVPPEQLIARVKEEIRSITEDRDQERAHIECVVRRCIESFFATAKGPLA